jgi:hypothetical protein
MAMEPGGEKVACVMAKAGLFKGKVFPATAAGCGAALR